MIFVEEIDDWVKVYQAASENPEASLETVQRLTLEK
jgi:hypothetical protein